MRSRLLFCLRRIGHEFGRKGGGRGGDEAKRVVWVEWMIHVAVAGMSRQGSLKKMQPPFDDEPFLGVESFWFQLATRRGRADEDLTLPSTHNNTQGYTDGEYGSAQL